MICPLCNKPHHDEPSPGRTRVCKACSDEADAIDHALIPKPKKRRSKQTPAPPIELPPTTE